MSSSSSSAKDVTFAGKPHDQMSVQAGEVTTHDYEYERYLVLQAEFQAANGQSHRRLLRKCTYCSRADTRTYELTARVQWTGDSCLR